MQETQVRISQKACACLRHLEVTLWEMTLAFLCATPTDPEVGCRCAPGIRESGIRHWER